MAKPNDILNPNTKGSIEQRLKSMEGAFYDLKDQMEWMFRHISDENVDMLSFDKLSGGSIDLTEGVTVHGDKETTILDQYGLDPRFLKWFPNKCYNSSFEIFDSTTLIPKYWDGGVSSSGSAWDGTYSMKLEYGETSTQTSAGGPNPQWWNDMAKTTRVSFHHKGGAVTISVLDGSDGDSAFTINNQVGNHGTSLEFEANTNWEAGYCSISFTHGTCTDMKVKFENTDSDEDDAYIDGVIIEPDYTRSKPSAYSDGPYSLGYANGVELGGQVVDMFRDSNSSAVEVDTTETTVASVTFTATSLADMFISFSAEINPTDALRVTAKTYVNDVALTYQPTMDVFGTGNYVFTYSDMSEDLAAGETTVTVKLVCDSDTVDISTGFGVLSIITSATGLETVPSDDLSYSLSDVSSLEYDSTYGDYQSLVVIDDTHIICAYTSENSSGAGLLKTFLLDGSYAITEIDSVQYCASTYDNSLIKLDDTHFVLAYADASSDGHVATIEINGSYEMTILDDIEQDSTFGYNNSLAKINDTHFALAYTGNNFFAYLSTFSVDGSYNLSKIDTLTISASSGTSSLSLCLIDSTHLICAYSDSGSDGYIGTFSFDGSYETITKIDELEHDTSSATGTSLTQIDDTHYAMALGAGSGNEGCIKIFSIDGSYNVTETSSLEHDSEKGTENSLILIDSTHLMLAYEGNSPEVKTLKTFSFDGSYAITEIDDLSIEALSGTSTPHLSLAQISLTHYALAYQANDNTGWIKIFELS